MQCFYTGALGSQISAVSACSEAVVCAVASRQGSQELVFTSLNSSTAVTSTLRTADHCRITTVCVMRAGDEIMVAFGSRSGAFIVERYINSLAPAGDIRLISAFPAENTIDPECSIFDESGLLVAFGLGRRIEILKSSFRGGHFASFDAHQGKITALTFFIAEAHLLVSASEDRTFQTWDLAARVCVYKSSVFPTPLMCATANRLRVVIAGTDGRIWVHEWLPQAQSCREMSCIDLRKANCRQNRERSRVQCMPHDAPVERAGLQKERDIARKEDAFQNFKSTDDSLLLPLAMVFDSSGRNEKAERNAIVGASCTSPEMPLLFVACTSHLCAVNIVACEALCISRYYKRDRACIGTAAYATYVTPPAPSSAYHGGQPMQIAVSSAFEPRLFAGVISTLLQDSSSNTRNPVPPSPTVKSHHPPETDSTENSGALLDTEAKNKACVSFFATPGAHIGRHSPLLAKEPRRQPQARRELFAWDAFDNATLKAGNRAKLKNSTSKNSRSAIDKPVVFHSHIKSSGYGKSVNSTPSTRATQQHGHTGRNLRKPSLLPSVKQYPIECAIMEAHQPKHDFRIDESTSASVSSAITTIACARNAGSLALTTTNTPTLIHRLPISTNRNFGPTLLSCETASHARHLGTNFSHDCRMLVTTASDGMLQIWPVNGERLVDTPRLTISSETSRVTSKAAARFFYMDRFVVFADGSALKMHTYDVPTNKKNAPATSRSPHNSGCSKLAHAFEHGEVQNLTAIGCLNSELSPLIITAASDRSVHILDAAIGRTARVIQDAHAKPIHTLSLPITTSATHIPQVSDGVFLCSL